jgi:hypothetical protein
MESSHISYRKWALAFHLMASSKKGMSAHQLHRMLGVTYKTAWFLAHRIREAMREINPEQLGGEGKFVEADETFTGGKAKNRAYASPPPKEAVMALVERGGKVRSYHVPEVTAATLKPIIVDAIAKDTHFRTDESGVYWKVGEEFASHKTVIHSIGEYVRGDAHTNTIEGYFSIFQTRDLWRVSPRQSAAPKAVSRRIRFPLQRAHGAGRERCAARGQGYQGRSWQAANVSTCWWNRTGVSVSWCAYAISYCFLAGRDLAGARRLRPLPAISLCGLGGVLSARRIASSRRRAVSSGEYRSSSCLRLIGP